MRLLKKELLKLEKDELIEVILSAYGASKETKEYFDFFLNPDIDLLREKYQEMIVKEFRRTRRVYYSKARINTVRRIIKKFSSFDPGSEYVVEFYIFTITHSLSTERNLNFTPVLYNGTKKLAEDLLKYADKHRVFDLAVKGLSNLIKSDVTSTRFRRLLGEVI
ncbi:MAG: hypothetical protein J1E99_05865 [Muribaculaceae bacterium]|nr:hypothetical protein [Muribaculaceae bacterium]